MNIAMLLPSLLVLASIAAAHAAWWLLGDLVLEHVGIPFLDAGYRRERSRVDPLSRRASAGR